MKSLVIKDIYSIKHNIKQFPLFMIFMALCLIPTSGAEGYVVFGSVMFAMLTITTFSLDERSKWEKYALIMPVSRKQYVKSKYIIHLIFSGIGVAAGVLIGGIGGLLFRKLSLVPFLVCAGVGIVISLLFGCIMIPLMFRYGAEKARMYMIATFAVPALIIFLGYKVITALQIKVTGQMIGLLCVIGAVVILAVPVISYIISLKSFAVKEF